MQGGKCCVRNKQAGINAIELEGNYNDYELERDIDRHEAEVFSQIEGGGDTMETSEWISVEGEKTLFDEPEVKPGIRQTRQEPDKSNARNFRITEEEEARSAKEKFRGNLEAIRLLEKIKGENRIATPEEQRILSKYVGWGGFADAFDEGKSAWANEYRELKELLSPEEYRSVRESTLNAHYTNPVIIRAMYEVLGKMGKH